MNADQCFVECEFLSSAQGVLTLIEMINQLFVKADCLKSLRIREIKKPLMKNVGLGRLGHLREPMKISDLVNRVKIYLNMTTFRLALGNGKNLGNMSLYIYILQYPYLNPNAI